MSATARVLTGLVAGIVIGMLLAQGVDRENILLDDFG